MHMVFVFAVSTVSTRTCQPVLVTGIALLQSRVYQLALPLSSQPNAHTRILFRYIVADGYHGSLWDVVCVDGRPIVGSLYGHGWI